jgi:hypothetical protein
MAKKVYGPYKGSKQNGGRKIYVIKKKGKTTSTNKARLDYERASGRTLPRSVSVDHKDNRKNNDSRGNLRTISRSKNTAKENKRRAGKR